MNIIHFSILSFYTGMQKFKYIISVLIVLALFLPSGIKILHHHEHVEYPGDGYHFNPEHEKCPACSFEFSIFLSEKDYFLSAKISFADTCNNDYTYCHHSNLSRYSFSLRAPPLVSG